MKTLLATLAVLAAVAATVLPARADEYSYQRTLDLSMTPDGVSTLAVSSYNGNVHLYADGGSIVRVHAVLKARSADALQHLNVQPSQHGTTLQLDDVCPATRNFIFWQFKDCDIDLEVHYPAALAVTLTGENGNVVSEGSSSSLTLKNSNGNVGVASAAGNVQIKNTNGNVSVTLARNWRGNSIELHTSAGNVHLTVPSDFAGTYKTKTTLGDVVNHANTRSGGPTVTATTTFGNVVISQQ